MIENLRLIELFAGYGSQALALKYLGIPFEHHFVCEFDKYAIQSYNDIHGTDFEVSDIRNIHADDLNIVDTDKYKYLMTYSFPCTDLSLAGKRKGMQRGSGTSSSLLWEVERLLKECKELPQYLLMENVPQVISKDNIKLFGEWTSFLVKLGYKNQYKLLNAKDYGVSQNRERCFMVSILKSENKDFVFPPPHRDFSVVSDILLDSETVPDYMWLNTNNFPHYLCETNVRPYLNGRHRNLQIRSDIKCSINQYKSNLKVYYDNGLSNTLQAKNSIEITGGNIIKIYIKSEEKIRGLVPQEHFRLMGVKDEDYNKITVTDKQKYKQAGNSIVVDVLMAIFKHLFIVDCNSNRLF